MKKSARSNSPINLNSDNDNYWFNQFQKNLEKISVQPKSKENLIEEINSIMNGSSSKFRSVQEKVDDMLNRSGVREMLAKKASEKKEEEKKDNNFKMPVLLVKVPSIRQTLDNFITDTKGNLSIPAIIEKIKSIHKNDVSDTKDFDSEDFVKLVSHMNLKAKSDNHDNEENYQNLGRRDVLDETDIDPSNSDAFISLVPAKV